METIKNQLEANTFTAEETNRFRASLREAGKLFGQRVVAVMLDHIDLKYNDRAKRGINQLIRPIKKCFTEAIDIIKVSPMKTPDGDLYVIFNDRPELKFPIRSGEVPSFVKATPQDVQDALIKFGESKGEAVVFFTDVNLVNEVITSNNTENAALLRQYADEFLNQANALEAVNKIEKDSTANYLKSLEA